MKIKIYVLRCMQNNQEKSHYQPSEEEIEQAKQMMTDEQYVASARRAYEYKRQPKPEEKEKSIEQKNTKIFFIDISGANGKEEEIEVMFRAIKKQGIYSKDALYRGTTDQEVLSGKNPSIIFCSTESDIRDHFSLRESALEYALEHIDGILLVLDSSKLRPLFLEYNYKLIQGVKYEDAILGIAKFKF